MVDAYIMQTEEKEFGKDRLDSYSTEEILDAKYEKANLDKVLKNQTQLNHKQRTDFYKFSELHKTLFNGTLGVYPHKTFHIRIEKRGKPKHLRPYKIPHVHLKTFKKELRHLVELSVL